MKLTGIQRIAAPKQRVWEALNDPEILKQSIPGCQALEKEGDKFRATVALKIGPMDARFAGSVQLTDLNPPNSYTIVGQGQGGPAGFAKGSAKVTLAEEGGETVLSYDVDAQVGGRLAQLGGPIIDATAKQIAGQFFKHFSEAVAPSAPRRARAAASGKTPAAQGGQGGGLAAPLVWILGLCAAAAAGFILGSSVTEESFSPALVSMLALILAVAATVSARRGAGE